jgi:DNA-binding transcriptional ArsR family regulator
LADQSQGQRIALQQDAQQAILVESDHAHLVNHAERVAHGRRSTKVLCENDVQAFQAVVLPPLARETLRVYSRDMSLTNPYGDFELADPQAMRALAHPVRLAILERLQRHGPATATQLSPHVGATPSVTSWHLRHLATFGLVEDWEGGDDRRLRWWKAARRGFRISPALDDPAGQAAARLLGQQMFLRYHDLPQEWLERDEPHLEPEWRQESGLANTGVTITLDELRQVEADIENVLAPYVQRGAEGAPPGARGVRMMRYVMPEAEQPPAATAEESDEGGRDS